MISITIIIPVFNVEKYIRRCIESVMTQDTAGADVECIVVDDCTPDGSMIIVNDMITSYHGSIRFVVIQHQENKGLSAARNTGEAHAKGDYIFFIDSDDWIFPGSISCFVEQLSKHPGVDVIMADYVRSEMGNQHDRQGIKECLMIEDNRSILEMCLQNKLYIYAWNKLVRRKLLVDNNLKFIDGIIHEDITWTYHLFSNASKLLILPAIIYIYESVPTSIMNTERQVNNARKGIHGFAISIEYILNSPPRDSSLTVDFILFCTQFLLRMDDILINVPQLNRELLSYQRIRWQLHKFTMKKGRLLLSAYLLLFYFPFRYLPKLRIFRKNYYKLEKLIGRLSHLTDFLHTK